MSKEQTIKELTIYDIISSFRSKIVEKGKTEFNPNIHITKPVVRLSPSRRYFTLLDISYERVEAPAKKTAKPKPSGGGGGNVNP